MSDQVQAERAAADKRYRDLDAAYKHVMVALSAVACECDCGMNDFAAETMNDVLYYWLRVAGQPDLIPEGCEERGRFGST